MKEQELLPHLFRTEFRKITSVLCKRFGIEHIEVAEDIVSETFLAAMETWPYQGLPDNPAGWLYSVAKNKAKNQLSRNAVFKEKIAQQLMRSASGGYEMEIDWSAANIRDSQLQMLFAVCHPSISNEAQVGLALRILCGFGIDEIADAFLTSKETINKRLFRAKEKLRQQHVQIEFPAEDEIKSRMGAVLTTLYLLFSEGYYSESTDLVMRNALCLEAMRLTYLLLENEATNQPEVNALLSLMCFQASRFEARKGENGEMILYNDQDERLWNTELIARGGYFLHRASQGDKISKYHMEAGIAYWHTIKADTPEKWENILYLFNQLLMTGYAPIAALNRTYAFSKVYGKPAAIAEAEKLQLTSNHFYFTLLGELYRDIDKSKARAHFNQALSLAKSGTDKQVIQSKLDSLG